MMDAHFRIGSNQAINVPSRFSNPISTPVSSSSHFNAHRALACGLKNPFSLLLIFSIQSQAGILRTAISKFSDESEILEK
jgi:hypothetical protein